MLSAYTGTFYKRAPGGGGRLSPFAHFLKIIRQYWASPAKRSERLLSVLAQTAAAPAPSLRGTLCASDARKASDAAQR
jgi:hypothetical protein